MSRFSLRVSVPRTRTERNRSLLGPALTLLVVGCGNTDPGEGVGLPDASQTGADASALDATQTTSDSAVPIDGGASDSDGHFDAAGPLDAGALNDADQAPDASARPPCPASLPSAWVWLVGDSTVATSSGWGDFLGDELTGPATVLNRGRSGRSSRSYYEESGSSWRSSSADAVTSALAAGDFVLIQFGHNDAKPDLDRHTEPGTAPDYRGSFRDYLERYINETRAAGATPILVTSVSRMTFDETGAAVRTHGDYPDAARRVAEDNRVALLDLEEESFQLFNSLGEAATLQRFADTATDDRTHFPASKAGGIATLVAGLLAASDSPLRCYVR